LPEEVYFQVTVSFSSLRTTSFRVENNITNSSINSSISSRFFNEQEGNVFLFFLMEQEGHTPTEILLKPKEDSTKKLSYRKKQTVQRTGAMILIQVPSSSWSYG
jgi:hypothetical protein